MKVGEGKQETGKETRRQNSRKATEKTNKQTNKNSNNNPHPHPPPPQQQWSSPVGTWHCMGWRNTDRLVHTITSYRSCQLWAKCTGREKMHAMLSSCAHEKWQNGGIGLVHLSIDARSTETVIMSHWNCSGQPREGLEQPVTGGRRHSQRAAAAKCCKQKSVQCPFPSASLPHPTDTR